MITLALLIMLAQEVKDPCLHPAVKARIHDLTLLALDEAFKRRVINLYEVWVNDLKSPRWKTGMDKNIRAYALARKDLQEWNLETCKE